MITAVLPVVFTLNFGMRTPNQTFEGYMYTRLTVGKEVCRSFGRRKHVVARHRNYRLVLSLRSRYRQKTNSLPPKNYRRMALPAEFLPPSFGFTASDKVVTAKKGKTAYRRNVTAIVWFCRLRQSRYRQKTKKRLPLKNYRRMALPPHLCPPKRTLPTITLK